MASSDDPHTVRLLVVADSHLSARAPSANTNWAAIAPLAAGADLVVHAGDASLDGSRDSADLGFTRQVLDRLPVPWVAVPGNHDVGDSADWGDSPVVDARRLERWRTLVGADRWGVDLGAWTIVGVNAQLFGAGLADEDEQWAWLEALLACHPPDKPLVFLSHKPLAAPEAELAVAPRYRFVTRAARRHLTDLLDARTCPLVISGHVHQRRLVNQGGRQHLWAPTTWAVLPDSAQRTVGVKRCGALMVELGEDGTVRSEVVEPEGLRQLTLAEDIPDPYR